MNTPLLHDWITLARPQRLASGDVHVWRACCAAGSASERAILSDDELQRADRFVFEGDRRRFIGAHAAVRTILAGYLECEPRAIRFAAGPHGKPRLAAPVSSLRFNLSHSRDVMLLAVADSREVGIDVEAIRDGVACLSIAREWFEPEDIARIERAPADDQRQLFFEMWTRLEAGQKALGLGITAPHKPLAGDRWTQQALDAGPGFAAALAVEGRSPDISCYTWQS